MAAADAGGSGGAGGARRDAPTVLDREGLSAWRPPFALGAGEELAFPDAIARIEAAVRLGIDPSLEPERALLEELGHPERAYRCLQVVGTNGKTSTARYTAALLHARGLKTGLYTSPHLVDYTERVEVDGAPVSHADFALGVSWALAAWKRLEGRGDPAAASGVTEFELLTAAALVMYALAGAEAAVLEVGLGGRWDATSAVRTCACAVTGIGMDHMALLGDTLAEIAGEKAGVIHAGVPCVLGVNAVRPREVADVMLGRCAEQGVVPVAVVQQGGDAPQGRGAAAPGAPSAPASDAPAGPAPASSAGLAPDVPRCDFRVVSAPHALGQELVVDVSVEVPARAGSPAFAASYPGVVLRAPIYQAQNVACALALATVAAGEALPADMARAAVSRCPVPGRFEVLRVDPLVVVDACHNPQSARAFADAVRMQEPDARKRPTLLFGALADKDWRGITRVLAPLFPDIVVTQSSSPRALPARELAAEVKAVTGTAPKVVPDAELAVQGLAGSSFVCCGTITLVGQVVGLLGR